MAGYDAGKRGESAMSDVMTASEQPRVEITESAAARIAVILDQEENRGMMLRIAVSGGGCSGFQYGFTFDTAIGETDVVLERGGAKVLIDDVSLEMMKGAKIDYVEDMIGAAFQIKNPVAKTSCGCGNSFSV
jgi:iron-sulfur cluster insertion protein